MFRDVVLEQLRWLARRPGWLCNSPRGEKHVAMTERSDEAQAAVLGVLTRSAAEDGIDRRRAVHPCPFCG